MVADAWRELNATQRDILVLLAIDGPRSGADCNRALGKDPDNSPVAYVNLDALRDRGYVESRDTDDRRVANHLTDAGRELVREGVVETARQIEAAEVLG